MTEAKKRTQRYTEFNPDSYRGSYTELLRGKNSRLLTNKKERLKSLSFFIYYL
jgi:hypothetical protein